MHDPSSLKDTSPRTAQPDGIDPLIREAAADAPASALCRAAFKAIRNGELVAVSVLAKSTGASSQDECCR